MGHKTPHTHFFGPSGGGSGTDDGSNKIFEYNVSDEEWKEVGTMKERRMYLGVSIVSYKDFAAWCT